MTYKVQFAEGIDATSGDLPDGTTVKVHESTGILEVTWPDKTRTSYAPGAWLTLTRPPRTPPPAPQRLR